MRLPVHHRPFPEILIERYEDPALLVRQAQDDLITRVDSPIPRPDGVMTRFAKPPGRAAPDAGVQQKPHAAGSVSRGSCRAG